MTHVQRPQPLPIAPLDRALTRGTRGRASATTYHRALHETRDAEDSRHVHADGLRRETGSGGVPDRV